MFVEYRNRVRRSKLSGHEKSEEAGKLAASAETGGELTLELCQAGLQHFRQHWAVLT